MGDRSKNERLIRVFTGGGNQIVKIPRGFELATKRAILRKNGVGLAIDPVAPKSLLEVLATLKPLDEDPGPINDPPPETE